MNIEILKEAGREEALIGLMLSYDNHDNTPDDIAARLAKKDGGHNKFLESICVWLDISAPRYFWQQFDTYRVGVTKQSESTMHTILNKQITNSMFERPISIDYIVYLNTLAESGGLEKLKNDIPEGFIQRRVVCTNYKALRGMYFQRKKHRLKEWRTFCEHIVSELEHPEYIK